MSAHTAYHRIRHVSIVGGFLDGAQFELADGLNCFIGAGRRQDHGGRTDPVPLDALPNRDTYPAERRRIETLVERNLAGGRIEVTIETKDGLSYIISRSAGEEPNVLTADRQPTDITFKAGGVFRATSTARTRSKTSPTGRRPSSCYSTTSRPRQLPRWKRVWTISARHSRRTPIRLCHSRHGSRRLRGARHAGECRRAAQTIRGRGRPGRRYDQQGP